MVAEWKLVEVVGARICVALSELEVTEGDIGPVDWIHVHKPLPVGRDVGWVDHKATEE